jgi:outer membrane protein assembly factor BamD
LKRFRSLILVSAIALALAACKHGSAQSSKASRAAVDAETQALTNEQLFARAEEQFAHKKYQKARNYYIQIYENNPNDALGRRAYLRVGDSFFAQGDPVNLVEAQYKYRDFINRYPGSDRADYAMLQIAMISYKQMERPDRDQQKTREALEKFNDMIHAYPTSPLRAEADQRLQEVLDRLAQHDHIIARFYIKRKSFGAAIIRLNSLVDTYPNYRDRAGVFYDLGTALTGMGRKAEARLYYERVISEYPKSDYAAQAKRKLDSLKTA